MITYIPKDIDGLPDFYKMTLFFINGKQLELEVASHRLIEHVKVPSPEGKFADENGRFDVVANPVPMWEIFDHENKKHDIPVMSVSHIAYDLNYSKVLECHQKFQEEAREKARAAMEEKKRGAA